MIALLWWLVYQLNPSVVVAAAELLDLLAVQPVELDAAPVHRAALSARPPHRHGVSKRTALRLASKADAPASRLDAGRGHGAGSVA